jgi:prepilin-type N-terminal cleavage/methylation domain-containing protein
MMLKQSRRHRRTTRGFSLVESIVSTLIVGFLLVVATSTVATSTQQQATNVDEITANTLADSLLAEISSLDYMEPGVSVSAIARESGEASNSKTNYDDVDDFHGWQEQPPQTSSGIAIPNRSSWKRSVSVQWVIVNNDGTMTGSMIETRSKRIQVDVLKNDQLMLRRYALKTSL